MSDNDSKSMLERLVSLEVWADARRKEFEKLKELKESVYTLQKDNFDMKKDYCDMKKDLFVLRAENEKLAEVNENLTEKLESLEVKLVKDTPFKQANKQEIEIMGRKIEKLDSLETTVATLVNDIPDMRANMQQTEMLGRKLTKLEGLETTVARLVNDIPVMQANKQKIKKLARKFKGMGKTVKQLSTLRKVLGRTMMSARGGPSQQVDAKVDALETRTLAIEGKLGDVHQSVTSVHVKTRDEKLVTRQYVPLDRRDDGWGDDIDGLWDAGRRRVVVRRGGRYRVGGRWKQRGAGVVDVSVDWAGSRSGGRDLGRTRDDLDRACGMIVVELEEGDEVWLEACRREGGARIWWCGMFCWLL